MPFSLRQVCLWSSVWLPTGNQVCCCSHGFDNPASVPCRCGHHPGSAGVVCRGAWVALWSRWDVIYTCVEQKTSCPQFEFVFVCVLLCPPNSDMIAFSNLLPSSSPWAQQTPSPLLWNSPHILRSVSLILHPLSTGYPVSSPCLPASCLKQENKIARQPPPPPTPHRNRQLVKTANAQADRESVNQNVGEGNAWGVSECVPARCNQRRVSAGRPNFGPEQLVCE